MIEANRGGCLDVVRYLHEECGHKVMLHGLEEFQEPETCDYVIRRYDERHSLIEDRLLNRAVVTSTAEVVKYLVFDCSMWTFDAFEMAIFPNPEFDDQPGEAKQNPDNLEICKVLYAVAKERARVVGEPVIKVLTRGRHRIRILDVAAAGNFKKAAWLAECVPEIDCAKKNRSNPEFDKLAKAGDPRLTRLSWHCSNTDRNSASRFIGCRNGPYAWTVVKQLCYWILFGTTSCTRMRH